MKREFTKLMAALALLLFIAPLGMWGQTTVTYGWENSDDASQWTISSSIVKTEGEGNNSTYAGKINTNHTYVQFKEKVYVTSFSFALKRTSGNGNYNVYIETSTDGETWTAVETFAMSAFGNGTYTTKSHTFDGSTQYYVRFHCYNTTATRYVDDVTIAYTSGVATTYSVNFDVNGGTFVSNSDFPNVSNNKVAGTYTLPSATKTGYTFAGWLATGASTPVTGSYEVTGDVAFTAQWVTGSTGTINFGNNAGRTPINGTNVTGTDSQNNTWTITTVFSGTTSFAQHGDYSQVGSSNNPATSITFTTTLPSSVNVLAFSAQFGGYSGTKGDVTLKVGNTVVGTGSLNGTNTVVVQSTSQAIGTVLTVTIENIEKGVNCYWISYTISDANAPTITFNPNTIDLGNIPAGQAITRTFDVIQSNLTSGITLTASNGQLNPSSIAQGDGTTTVTWSCTPTAGTINVTITATSGSLNPTMTITGTAKTVHDVNITASQNGSVSASPASAIEGETITLTVTPASGYYLSALNVVNASTSEAISVSNNTFTMPDANVTVSATFGLIVPSTVSFSINGKIEMTATVNSSANVSIDMTKFVADVTTNGYIFKGWYTQANGGTKIPDTYQPSGDITVYAQFGEPAADAYELVTNASQLEAGKLVVIAAADYDYAISTTQNNNNRAQAGITKSGNTITLTSSVCEFVLGGSTGAWTFYDDANNGFIYAASSSANHLKTQANNDANGEWAITFENNVTKVVAKGTNTRNNLRYNSSNNPPIFSCYASTSGMANVCLYIKPAGKNTRENVEATSKVTAIDANVLVTVKANGIVYLTGANAGNESNLVVEEGGQLVASADVQGTMLKSIQGYSSTRDNYYFLSSPLTTNHSTSNTDPANVGNMLSNDYDLYYFNQDGGNGESELLEWRNYHANPFNMFVGSGYLYANSDDVDLEFAGTIRKNLDNGDYAAQNRSITYVDGFRFSGWNLVGNPFPSNAKVNMSFYKMNDTGEGINVTPLSANSVIAPMEGVFVVTEANDQVTFTATTAAVTTTADRSVMIDVNRDNEFLDRAIVEFNNGSALRKLNLNENATKVYFQQGQEEFAIVAADNEGELPVNFKASRNGRYTMSFDVENLDMNYLHLIDNKTGNDVDLLATPSYTFQANSSDYESRFRLVFKANAIEENDTEANTTFAYYNGSEWIINNSGNATLQVIDMMGRVLSSQTLNGNANVNINQPAGIYMLRLVNGENVMVQKVVVR